jgi:hypothetical protein
MRVSFFIHDATKRIVSWEARIGKRTRVPGALMGFGTEAPHDLVQYVIEAATGSDDGFWGLVARGATFRSAGRRRTRPGRAIIAAHRDELRASEQLAAVHLVHWRNGAVTPVTDALSRAQAQWDTMRVGDVLVFEWPSSHGQIEKAAATARRARARSGRSGAGYTGQSS